MIKKLLLIVTVVLALVCNIGCGVRNLVPGELPESGRGVAFIRVNLSGIDNAIIHVFTQGNRLGPHKARIEVQGGDAVYAIALEEGVYDIGQVSAGLGTDIWEKQSNCPSFVVKPGFTTYIGSIILTVDYPIYNAKCAATETGFEEAVAAYQRTYPMLYEKYPIRR